MHPLHPRHPSLAAERSSLSVPSESSAPLHSPGLAQSPSPNQSGQSKQSGRLDNLLADLGSLIQRGGSRGNRPSPHPCSTGFPQIDQLLGGGFPRGCLSEITGPPSSGRTSLALTLLAETTRSGALAAVIDRADTFDPSSAVSSGVDLDQVLWVRAPAMREALRCAERLLQTEGFPLVLLDLIESQPSESRAIQRAAWVRLSRLAAGTRSALVLLSQERLAGPQAEITLAMQPAQAHFTGTPPLLEELEARALLVRHRAAPVDRAASVRLVESRAA